MKGLHFQQSSTQDEAQNIKACRELVAISMTPKKGAQILYLFKDTNIALHIQQKIN